MSNKLEWLSLQAFPAYSRLEPTLEWSTWKYCEASVLQITLKDCMTRAYATKLPTVVIKLVCLSLILQIFASKGFHSGRRSLPNKYETRVK
jgi:hypothetical protein